MAETPPGSHETKGMLRLLEEAHIKNTTIKGVTDVEWDRRVREWDKERQQWIRQMVNNSVWAMGSPLVKAKDRGETGGEGERSEVPDSHEQLTTGPRNYFGLDPALLHGIQSEVSAHNIHGGHRSSKQGLVAGHPSNFSPEPLAVPKTIRHKKMTRLELLKFISDWDKASFGRRDKIVMEFIKSYKTKENVYDSDSLFQCGGSLIFCRLTISLQMCFLKHRVVWHYFDALAIFVKSLQRAVELEELSTSSDRYSEEFLRLGGLGFICEVIRVEVSGQADKLHACKFLVDLMKGRKSITVKMFVCDNPHFLESLVDSLTMCKDKKLINYCGFCFENLCIEATIQNVMVVTNYVMRLLPCDFNPSIQSMAFRVLQGVVRLKPSVGAKCVKPILDNLKTEDMDLLVEMSNLSLVILQTKYGPELINQLMLVAEGIQLREQFKSVFKPHMRKGRSQPSREHAQDLRRARDKHDRVRQKMQHKFDHFLQQAGALFVLNRMMTNKIDFVTEFTKQGIFGLSLKTLGSCPHWEVQGQGVTMVQFLHAMSMECAVSYFLMLPEKMMILILEKPAECLRYFTAPICVLLRKLGRFALRLWDRWVEKVVIPAQEVSQDGILPSYFIDMCKMTRKVHEIQQALADLLEHPVMESYSKTPEEHSLTDEGDDDSELRDFITDDEDDILQYRSGKDALFEGRTFSKFQEYLDFNMELSDDKFDIKVNKSQPSVLLAPSKTENELGAYEQALLQDAEKSTTRTIADIKEEADSQPEEKKEARGSLDMDDMGSDKGDAV